VKERTSAKNGVAATTGKEGTAMDQRWKVLLPGIPVSSDRGALGWCSVSLLRLEGRLVLVDTGSYGDRALLLARLREEGVAPGEVAMVFLTHFHYDHMLNFDLFENAELFLSFREEEYVAGGGYLAAGDPFVPAALYPLLRPRLRLFAGEEYLLPGLRTIPLPGHTPGLTGLLLEESGILFAGDGVKNAREFAAAEAPPVFADPAAALRSYVRAAEVARVVVPGHDNPFRLPVAEKVDYLSRTKIEIVWAGEPERASVRLVLGSSEPAGFGS
jgi:N-acyl homoserine lactone hydrolase